MFGTGGAQYDSSWAGWKARGVEWGDPTCHDSGTALVCRRHCVVPSYAFVILAVFCASGGVGDVVRSRRYFSIEVGIATEDSN